MRGNDEKHFITAAFAIQPSKLGTNLAGRSLGVGGKGANRRNTGYDGSYQTLAYPMDDVAGARLLPKM